MNHEKIIEKVCKRHFVPSSDITSNKKSRIVVAARYNTMHELYINGYEPRHIARLLNLERTTVYKGIDKAIERNPDCTWESSNEKHNSCFIKELKSAVNNDKRQIAKRAYNRIIMANNKTVGSPTKAIYEKGGNKLLLWLVSQTPEGSTIMDTMSSIAFDAMDEEENNQ
jgi:hypothetical protein